MNWKEQTEISEPFQKTWTEPQIIVSRDDIIHFENVQATSGEKMSETENFMPGTKTQEILKDMKSVSTLQMSDCLQELRNSLSQAQFFKQHLETRQKCNKISSDINVQSQQRDWKLPEMSRSRSLPSSPVIGSTHCMTSSPRISSNGERCFSFLPERLRQLENIRFLLDDDVDNGSSNTEDGVTFYSPCRDATTCSFEDRFLTERLSPRFQVENHGEVNSPMRAKRKLDMDDPYSSCVKRTKSDLVQEAGQRYINQLEMDLMALKHRLYYVSAETETKSTNCACAEMKKQFMQMATSAYKSVRRCDGTSGSFERFKQELTQTNQVIKDSMELLQNVRRLCVH